MREIFAAEPRHPAAPVRIVLLPGAYQSPEDFLRAGFGDAVRARGLRVDLSFVDVELDVLTDRSVIERLRTEILLPARARGAAQVWLGGISLGGYIALDYASRAAGASGAVDGLCLFAPYLGNRMVIAEIARAGGVAAWQPGTLAECDEERRIWQFIQRRGASAPVMYLGYGREDRFAPAHALFAAALPASHVDVVPGGHEWASWQRLWENFLDSGWTCSGS
jgi:pimeloyl-ACP methyl ester carboxylesterase